MINLISFIPEIIILTLIILTLLVGLYYKDSSNFIILLNSIGFVIIAILFIKYGDYFQSINIEINNFNIVILSKILISLFTSIYILLIKKSLTSESIYRYEFFLFVLFATLGSFVLISSDNFLTAFIGIELQSLSLYLMAAFNTKNSLSNEAGIKYFSLGALSSGFLLFGISMVYYDNASISFTDISNVSYFTEIGLAIILISLFFKISAAPFHIWTPDVYEGSPTISVLFFATLPKFASLIFLLRFYSEMEIFSYDSLIFIFKFVSVASLLIGAYGALTQKVIKRLMAFSSINHVGFILLGILSFQLLSEGVFFFYLIIYIVSSFGIFSILISLRNENGELNLIEDLKGLKSLNRPKSICLLILFFSLAGIPPFAGFFAKFFILTAAINEGYIYLSIFAILSSVIAAFYYLTIIKNMFFTESDKKLNSTSMFYHTVIYLISALFVSLFAFYPDPIILLIDNLF